MNFQQFFSKYSRLLIPAAVLLMLVLYFLLPHGETEETIAAPSDLIIAEPPQLSETPIQNSENTPEIATEPQEILIEIKGQVKKPGVFELPAGARLHEAIELAGGLLDGADDLSLNMAMKLNDEMSVFVPEKGDALIKPPVVVVPSGPSASQSGTNAGGEVSVNINTADETGMSTLPGIGPSKAAAIIAHREENGPFATIEALKDVTGIGDKTFEQLKDMISIN